ncbi:MAG: beta-lactamase [Gemmatimonadetes bacterium]|nr:beta-lactamase [Gemmatimonadota bacterium]
MAALLVVCFAALALVRPYLWQWSSDVPRVRVLHWGEMLGRVTGLSDRFLPAALVDSAEAIVTAEVRRGAFPGATLAAGRLDHAVLESGIGRIGWGKDALLADADETLYDLASLTKVVATTAAVMALVDDGRMRLDDPVSRYLPTFTGQGREKVTIRHLLTHTSGMSPGAVVRGDTPGERLRWWIANARIYDPPGTKVVYSDGGFMVLGVAVAAAAGMSEGAYLKRRVYGPLGMEHTRFEPGKACKECAPTLSLKDGTPFRGETNDPLSRKFGGRTGNAGLFSTAHDVGRFAAMIANGGELDGVRVLKAATVREFTRAQPGAGTRALGWEMFCREGTVPDAKGCKTPYAYGHTGFTGTSLWIDVRRGVWVALLTNRTFNPRASNHLQAVRRRIFNVLTATPPLPSEARDTVETAR